MHGIPNSIKKVRESQGFFIVASYTVLYNYSIHLSDNALNRKDQTTDAAGDTDDEPEVLESVEVSVLVYADFIIMSGSCSKDRNDCGLFCLLFVGLL